MSSSGAVSRVGTGFPPRRLAQLSDRQRRWLRPVWFLTLTLALLLDLTGAAFVIHDVFENRPEFERLGLTSTTEEDGTVTVEEFVDGSAPGIAVGARIASINGKAIARDLSINRLAERLRVAPGPEVTIAVRNPNGALHELRQVRSDRWRQAAAQAAQIPHALRMSLRLLGSALSCAVLVTCAILLFHRRSRDPVALMLSFAFLGMAGTIDPPLMLWLASGLGDWYDGVVAVWWALFVVALAAFPDGRFVPRWGRWSLIAAPLATVPLSIDEVPTTVQLLIAVVLPVMLLMIALAIRYRRIGAGIERQQIKWTVAGFAGGLVLVGVSLLIAGIVSDAGKPDGLPLRMLALILFSTGFVLIPLGLLVSLTRFRLWEADSFISRSAATAIVTMLIGILWAASADLVKELVARLLGAGNATVATSVSAVLAVGIFAPTQRYVTHWTRRRFDQDGERLRSLAARLKTWRNSETPEEIGMRALAIIGDSVHASGAALLALTPTGRELIAARDIAQPDMLASPGSLTDGRFALTLPLEDDDGPVGTLLLGPRSDENKYNRAERGALSELVAPLAEALRTARQRAQQETGMQRMLSTVEQRLSRLEGGAQRV